MPATISTFPAINDNYLTWTAAVQPIQGQTFRPPNANDVVFDKITLQTFDTNGQFTYQANLYEAINNIPSGQSLGFTSGSYTATNPNIAQQFTVDFPDITLNPSKSYAFIITKTSQATGNTGSLGQGHSYDGGTAIYFLNNIFNNLNIDFPFTAYFISPLLPASGSELSGIPVGNLNERTNIAINLSGNYTGTGTFGIANPNQSGNTSLKTGKYGSLAVDALTGAFQYTPDQTKIKPLKTGETGVDEFTITLTGANNTVTSSTYRVEIIGDTGSDNGGGGNVKPDNTSITIAGSRGTVSGKSGIIIDGDTTDLAAGSTVKPYIRFPGQTEFTLGSARPTVDANGDFSWQRKTGKTAYVYFTDDSGDVISNRVVIPAGEARLASSSLQAFDSDPIVGGASYQHAGHKKGKRRRPVAAASFGNRLSEDTNSSLLMASDSSDVGFYKQHDLVAASGGNW